MPPVPGEISALLDELADLDTRAVRLISGPGALQDQFNAADPWATALREAADRAAARRVQIVGRIWDAEELSLAKLAARIGKSKSRTDELVRAAARAAQRQVGVSRET